MSIIVSILDRFKEASSWAGIASLLALVNINLEPGLVDKITIVGAAVAGLLAFILKDKVAE